jgi:hypothetical protein
MNLAAEAQAYRKELCGPFGHLRRIPFYLSLVPPMEVLASVAEVVVQVAEEVVVLVFLPCRSSFKER